MKSSSQAQSSSEPASNGRNGPSGSDSSDSRDDSQDHAFGKGARSDEASPGSAPGLPTGSLPGRSSEKGPRIIQDRDSADLEKVRDLLFGAQTQQHERDLQAQAERIEQLETRLSDRLGAMEKEFAAQVRNIQASLRDELQAEVAAIVARLDEQGSNKVERSDLRSMLSDLANRIGE